MKLLLSISLLLFTSDITYSGKTGYYYVTGYIYAADNPEIVVANQQVIINSDTILSDSNGRYLYKIYWATIGLFNKPIYSNKSPKYINIRVGSRQYSFKNRPKRYSIRKNAKKELPIENRDLQIDLKSCSVGAELVELYTGL